MLSIGVLGAGQEGYYTELARTAYYTGAGEAPGRWWGDGASALGLSGTVKPADLVSLSAGFSPRSGAPLVRNAGSQNRRPGFDLTFSAPKSVSVLWALEEEEVRQALEACHDEAVGKALQYLASDALSTRRGAQGTEELPAAPCVARFVHTTARSVRGQLPDPQLHTHCLLLNVCLGEDGKWSTLDGRPVFRHKMAAGVLYRTALFERVRSLLGLAARPGKASAELDCVPEEFAAAFSKRRQLIEAYLEKQGGGGARAAALAALSTRVGKEGQCTDVLRGAWQEEAAGLGWEGLRSSPVPAIPEAEQGELIRRALGQALSSVTEHKSHFASRELLREVLQLLEPCGVDVEAVQQAVQRAEELRLVRLQKFRGEQRFTTTEMLKLEDRVLDTARALQFRRHEVEPALGAEHTLSEEQEQALRHLLTGCSVRLLQGLAGTGKTFVLQHARQAWERAGFEVQGAALAAVAAKRLEEGAGIPSQSIYRFLQGLESGRERLHERSVLVLDEAAMVGTRMFARITEHVSEARAKLILVGDPKQLPAIEAGGPFEALAEQCGAATLEDIRRQREPWAREAVTCLARGAPLRALAMHEDRGLVCWGKDAECVQQSLVKAWEEAREVTELGELLVLTGTRQEAQEISSRIQRVRAERGEVETSDGVVCGEALFLVGDVVRFRRNFTFALNGETGAVRAVDSARGVVTIETERGEFVSVDVEEYPHLELAYAATTHAAQGATVERCLVYCGAGNGSREQLYVQASRARAETRFFIVEEPEGAGLSRFERRAALGLARDLLPELGMDRA